MPNVPVAPRRSRTAWCAMVAATALLIPGLVACDPDAPGPPPSSPSASSPASSASSSAPTPTPSPTPSPTSQREKDEAAIKQAVLDFRAVTQQLSMTPEADVEQLKSVATGALLDVEMGMYREWRAKGWRATKPVKIRNLAVASVTAATATAHYCADSTGVDVVDRNGKSQVVEGRPDLFPKLVELTKTEDGKWLPTRQTTEGNACDES